MAGLTGEAAVQTTRAVNGFNHAQRQTGLFQTRALFNMQFQTGAEIIRASRGHRDTAGI